MLVRAPHWTEEQAARALRVRRHLDTRSTPYVVMTRAEAIEKLSEGIVIPLTTTVRGLPNEVELDEAGGLPRSCVTSIDNLSTIARGQLVRIGAPGGTGKDG